ncbi:MAG: M23 family metallopeptidase [Bdellovibrionaceae bacterium]|nr:M23 family metallopeptidase [Pseudobdellovibrionaceae bacterium]
MKLKSMMVLALGLVTAQAQAQAEKEAYIELTETQMMRVVDANQSRTLVNLERVEAGAILGVDIATLNLALSYQRSIPNEVNYTYLNDQGRKVTSQNGFVCGLRLVDVNDDEQRESEIMERKDLCVSLVVFQKKTKVLEGNSAVNKAALEEAQTSATPQLLIAAVEDISNQMVADAAGDIMNPLVEFVAGGSSIVKPLEGSLIARSEFGMRRHPVYKKKKLHKGIDLRAKTGSTVRSAMKGRVLALKSERTKRGKLKGYGHYVIVTHPEKRMQTLYAHLSSFKTKVGASVAAGERIALSGATGVGTGPHLHFETHEGTKAVNPRKYIGKLLSSLEQLIEKYFSLA